MHVHTNAGQGSMVQRISDTVIVLAHYAKLKVTISIPLGDENHRTLVLCILYHISIEEKSRAVFAYTDCVPQV